MDIEYGIPLQYPYIDQNCTPYVSLDKGKFKVCAAGEYIHAYLRIGYFSRHLPKSGKHANNARE